MIVNGMSSAWVGVREFGSGNPVSVVTEEDVPKELWDIGQPDLASGNCVLINAFTGALHMEHCEAPHFYICEALI